MTFVLRVLLLVTIVNAMLAVGNAVVSTILYLDPLARYESIGAARRSSGTVRRNGMKATVVTSWTCVYLW